MNNWKSTDGYLLFDFSDVNPALTNQTVDGIYERAKNLIANNKFVLLVNEGVHTPIPAVVAYVNQAYVIETVLYAYTITSNDNVKKTNHEYGAATLEDMTDVSLLNPTDGQYIGYDAETNYWVNKSIAPIPTKTSQLTNDSGFVTSAAIPTKTSDLTNDSGFITDADVPVIDDTTTSATKVWSSDKVSSELSGKADSSSVPTKTSQLTNDSGFLTDADVPVIDDTAVVNNKVWSSYKTNSELLGKQNTLTAGSNISISGDTISATDTTYSEGTGIDITSNTVSLDINGLTSVSTLNGTDELVVYDGTGNKKTTTAAVLGLANVPQFEPLTTSDNNKLLGVSVSGGDISVGAVEINNYKRLYVLEYSFGAVQAKQEYSVSLATLTNNKITNLSQIGSFAITQCGGASNWDYGAVIWIKNSTPTTLTFIPSISQNDCRVWILFLYK